MPWSSLWVVSNVIACAIAAAAYSGAVRWVGAFGFREEFFRVLLVIFSGIDAGDAIALIWATAMQANLTNSFIVKITRFQKMSRLVVSVHKT